MSGASDLIERAPGLVELVSGLALDRASSFSRQLDLLDRALTERGYAVRVISAREQRGLGGVPLSIAARILLGYPDQFFSFDADEAPENRYGRNGRTFLWCQLSRPPRSPELGFFQRLELVALTPRTRDYLVSALGSSRPISVIPHGVDTELFRPGSSAPMRNELGVPEGFVVGAVGANTSRKRFDRVFESFARFRRMLGDGDAPAFLVVKTDRIIGLDGRDLRLIASRLGIAERTILIEGDWDADRMAELFRLFDLFVNVSEWEGFGIPVVEAMASGVPVVTHQVQGPAEILPYHDFVSSAGASSTEEGVLLVDADAADVARLLTAAYRNPELRSVRAREGRAAALAQYDMRRVAARWIDLIEQDAPTLSPP